MKSVIMVIHRRARPPRSRWRRLYSIEDAAAISRTNEVTAQAAARAARAALDLLWQPRLQVEWAHKEIVESAVVVALGPCAAAAARAVKVDQHGAVGQDAERERRDQHAHAIAQLAARLDDEETPPPRPAPRRAWLGRHAPWRGSVTVCGEARACAAPAGTGKSVAARALPQATHHTLGARQLTGRRKRQLVHRRRTKSQHPCRWSARALPCCCPWHRPPLIWPL